jgi:hypothetical protein
MYLETMYISGISGCKIQKCNLKGITSIGLGHLDLLQFGLLQCDFSMLLPYDSLLMFTFDLL